MNIDLHCHTTASDGTLSPTELINLACEREIDILSITDHDNVDAYQKIAPIGDKLTLIHGIEFSSQWRKSGVHIVGLNLNLNSDALIEGVSLQTQARRERGEKIAEKLARLGFDNSLEGAKAFTAGGEVGRPHFAQHLVAIGAVSNVQQAFKRYLGAGKAGDIKEQWSDMTTIISWIRAAGGVAVLAHPTKYKMTRSKLINLLTDFVAAGGQGMEVISGMQVPSVTQDLARLCNQFKLLASCGSDFHAPNQHWAALGMVAELPDQCKPIWRHWD
ncbi:MAG: PHP domain-containing protein [Porticoccaceae bacterium]